jgi:hypothetical protein
MRDYLSQTNLRNAAVLGLVIALMSIPRIFIWGKSPASYGLAAFLGMTLISGAATAWGTRAGMCGLFPERKRAITGMLIAIFLSLMMLPLYIAWIDPLLLPAIKATGDANMLAMRYPSAPPGQFALFMWSASFEVMFFQGGIMSVISRATGRQWVAVAVAVGIRSLVTSGQLSQLHIANAQPFLVSTSAVVTMISCLLFARFGLLATMVFSAGVCLHVLFL